MTMDNNSHHSSKRAGGGHFASAESGPARYAPQRGTNTPHMQPVVSYSRNDAHYRSGASASARRKKKRRGVIVALIVIAVLLAAGGGVAYAFIFDPPFFSVTVNGSSYTVDRGTTIQTVIDKGYATPTAGNLIAVDGSIATEGGGDEFEATLNGASVNDGSTVLKRDANLTISNGSDVNESYTETIETIPHTTSSASTDASSYYTAAVHIYSSGHDGEQVVRTGDVSGKTVTTVTKQAVASGYSTYNFKVGDDKVIALTFDDGPWSTTSQVLDVLKENGAHATFFEIGNQIANYTSVVKRAYDEGNQIGTHSWDHAAGSGQGVNMTYMTADEQVAEITKGFGAIDSALGTTTSRVMRAPGGNYYGSLIETLAPYVTTEVGWNVDTKDWSKPGVDSIVSSLEGVKPGQVVLMHDGGGDRSETIEALKTALPVLKAQGYSFLTIDEMIAKYGVSNS